MSVFSDANNISAGSAQYGENDGLGREENSGRTGYSLKGELS
jgi:hypothetical protein